MKKLLFTPFLIILLYACSDRPYSDGQALETITISGRVTDFEGNPIDSSVVRILYDTFESAYETYTSKDGSYKLEGIIKGKYLGMFAMRLNEYPQGSATSEDAMRLEFWAWNIIADRDMVINPRYHKLELYGTNVFKVEYGGSGYMIYVRPMSLGKFLAYKQKKDKSESTNLSIPLEDIQFEVFADDELLKIKSVQAIDEYTSEDNNSSMGGFIIQVDPPKHNTTTPYIVFRVVGEDKKQKEKGENIYFYEKRECMRKE